MLGAIDQFNPTQRDDNQEKHHPDFIMTCGGQGQWKGGSGHVMWKILSIGRRAHLAMGSARMKMNKLNNPKMPCGIQTDVSSF